MYSKRGFFSHIAETLKERRKFYLRHLCRVRIRFNRRSWSIISLLFGTFTGCASSMHFSGMFLSPFRTSRKQQQSWRHMIIIIVCPSAYLFWNHTWMTKRTTSHQSIEKKIVGLLSLALHSSLIDKPIASVRYLPSISCSQTSSPKQRSDVQWTSVGYFCVWYLSMIRCRWSSRNNVSLDHCRSVYLKNGKWWFVYRVKWSKCSAHC